MCLAPTLALAVPQDCSKYKGYKPSYCDPSPPKARPKVKDHIYKLPPRYTPPPPPAEEPDFLDMMLNPFQLMGNSDPGGVNSTLDKTGEMLGDPLGVVGKVADDPIGMTREINPLHDDDD